MTLENLQGVASAIITPRIKHTTLNKSHNIDINYTTFDRLLEWQYAKTDFIVVLGTTGEAEFLNNTDRELLVTKTCSYFHGHGRNKPVVVGASAGNTNDAISRSQMALELGADALLITPPPYVKPRQDGIVSHYKKISERTDFAPIVVYNVPSRVGVNILPETLEKIAKECNVLAVKEASGDLKQLTDYVSVSNDSFSVLSGDDATTFKAIVLGAKGVISVVSNIAPEFMHKMVNDALIKEYVNASEVNQKLLPLYEASMKFGNPVGIKAMMSLCGYNVGEAHPSLGKVNLEEMAVLKQYLTTVGEFR